MNTSDADTVIQEVSHIKGLHNIAADMARTLQKRRAKGNAIILCTYPNETHRALERQWARLTRQLQAKRADSNGATVVARLGREISAMQAYTFTTEFPYKDPQNNAFILGMTDTAEIFPTCQTLLIAGELDDATYHYILERIAPYSLARRYT